MREIHKSVKVMPGALIGENVEIAEGCYIGAGVVIGSVPESREYMKGKPFMGVKIGPNCFIGDMTTIHAGTTQDTVIGANTTILCHSHIGHDAILEDDCDLSPYSSIGGHAHLMRGAVVGMGGIVRQKLILGAYSMLGMGGILTKDIPPGEIWAGNPAKLLKKNMSRIQKFHVTEEELEKAKVAYEAARLYRT